jgi:ribosomal-protein-alanine N-acetyltransferase
MPEEPVRLRPIQQADLDVLGRLDTDPSAREPFEWTGFRDPHARRRRWEEDGWLGRDSATSPSACPTAPWPGS